MLFFDAVSGRDGLPASWRASARTVNSCVGNTRKEEANTHSRWTSRDEVCSGHTTNGFRRRTAATSCCHLPHRQRTEQVVQARARDSTSLTNVDDAGDVEKHSKREGMMNATNQRSNRNRRQEDSNLGSGFKMRWVGQVDKRMKRAEDLLGVGARQHLLTGVRSQCPGVEGHGPYIGDVGEGNGGESGEQGEPVP